MTWLLVVLAGACVGYAVATVRRPGRLSEYGQQVAHLLDPERVHEWTMGYYTLDHRPSGLRLWIANGAYSFNVYAHSFNAREGTWPPLPQGDRAKVFRRAMAMVALLAGRAAMTPEQREVERLIGGAP